MQGWVVKKLSQTGRVVLIKSVLQALPTFVMTCFRLPDTLIREIEGMFANFFWSSGQEAKIHWIAWRKMCKTKALGGMGFRRLKELNEALLAKQAWRVAMNPDTLLYRVLQHKYFPNSSFCNANFGAAPSFTWRSLLRSRDLLVACL
ncbi:UNVERIFIED_CONTAM: putative mitochondrial protein [Sesamum latifolium]|uniref:Mitochondrial protein n=1 Tax=Sesamum latifolium TaxID=2727402 RepID=A0AAW2SRS8_9LAMI